MQMRVKSISLTNIGCFPEMHLVFNDRSNIICGTNGIGKTTILDAIASVFASWTAQSIKRSGFDKGHINLSVLHEGEEKSISFVTERFLRDEGKHAEGGMPNAANKILYIKSSRDILYHKMPHIGRDPEKNNNNYMTEAGAGVSNTDLKNWLANRYLFSRQHDISLTDAQSKNFELAVKSFSILDPEIKFKAVLASDFNVMVETPDGIIPFEYLSSGYRAIFYIILGIIKEVEYRDKNNAAENFNGLFLIDEIELHLHPEWQRKVISIIEKVFPCAQLIITTHSPHVVQSATPDQLIVISRDEYNLPSVHPVQQGRFGFQGWTIEEILTDVMKLSSTQSEQYTEILKEFDSALEREDGIVLQEKLDLLLEMLHPLNPTRKLFTLQAAPVLGK
ncbi:AAA family ATPase [Roseomonas gilardii]|uniref:AAA family ATPase n=1 Tax=Roseomonas gilardii TaxID=257708 RepID=A0ABU3MI21_9PROT|nr:AAA family ATPase [Roseomonas gilardii]MDT8332300.1 AAA family ATPase [Roseomonas gilardii]